MQRFVVLAHPEKRGPVTVDSRASGLICHRHFNKKVLVMTRRRLSVWVLLLTFVGGYATAEDSAPNYRDAAMELADLLQTYYLFPDVGEQYATYLQSRAVQGDYDVAASDTDFAAMLTDGLQGVSEDAHLRVSVAGNGTASRRSPRRSPGNVIKNATWLADGVAYVAVTGLPHSEEVRKEMVRFLEEYEGADALVLDLRFCPGGSLSVMDELFSRLYGETTHLVTMDMRRGAAGVLESSFMNGPSLERQDAPPGIVRWHHLALRSKEQTGPRSSVVAHAGPGISATLNSSLTDDSKYLFRSGGHTIRRRTRAGKAAASDRMWK
jgi:hypothetical protein